MGKSQHMVKRRQSDNDMRSIVRCMENVTTRMPWSDLGSLGDLARACAWQVVLPGSDYTYFSVDKELGILET
jgi:hypothetical protein